MTGDAQSEQSSVFRAFGESEFVPSRPWQRVDAILRGNGGCFGIEGPRGAGKSWHMLRAVTRARSQGGVALWYPSPSEYDAAGFLRSLTDGLVSAVETAFKDLLDRRARERRRRSRWIGAMVLAVVFSYATLGHTFLFQFQQLSPLTVACIGFAADAVLVWSTLELVRPGPPRPESSRLRQVRWLNDYAISRVLPALGVGAVLALVGTLTGALPIVLLSAVVCGAVATIALTRPPSETEQFLHDAFELRSRVRFAETLRLSSELGAEVGHQGVMARLGRSRSRELVERVATLSSLVYDFRSFAERAAVLTERPVVIAIDELDKMAEPRRVTALLRDIKGIFEVPGVYFFVSVSREAARALKLGPIEGRNVFNSSFYTVIDIDPLDPGACVDLLHRRHVAVPNDVEWCLAVLAGGIPREFFRLVELAGVESRIEAARIVVASEADELRRAVLDGGSTNRPDARITVEAVKALRSVTSAIDGSREILVTSEALWNPTWASAAWDDRMGEFWRRFLVRSQVAALAASGPPESVEAHAADLAAVVRAASESAEIGRLELRGRFPGDVPAEVIR